MACVPSSQELSDTGHLRLGRPATDAGRHFCGERSINPRIARRNPGPLPAFRVPFFAAAAVVGGVAIGYFVHQTPATQRSVALPLSNSNAIVNGSLQLRISFTPSQSAFLSGQVVVVNLKGINCSVSRGGRE